MIRVTVSNHEIKIEGHAEGEDHSLICSAVSVLEQVMVEAVNNLTEDNINYDDSDAENGNTLIQFGEVGEQSRILIDAFYLGLCMVAAKYPQSVKISEKD